MSSAVRGNFGHIKEPGVLLLSKKDSQAKHRRNLIIAISVLGALIIFGLPGLIEEIMKEKRIRQIGKLNSGMTYRLCVKLEERGISVSKKPDPIE